MIAENRLAAASAVMVLFPRQRHLGGLIRASARHRDGHPTVGGNLLDAPIGAEVTALLASEHVFIKNPIPLLP